MKTTEKRIIFSIIGENRTKWSTFWRRWECREIFNTQSSECRNFTAWNRKHCNVRIKSIKGAVLPYKPYILLYLDLQKFGWHSGFNVFVVKLYDRSDWSDDNVLKMSYYFLNKGIYVYGEDGIHRKVDCAIYVSIIIKSRGQTRILRNVIKTHDISNTTRNFVLRSSDIWTCDGNRTAK